MLCKSVNEKKRIIINNKNNNNDNNNDDNNNNNTNNSNMLHTLVVARNAGFDVMVSKHGQATKSF